MKTRRYLFIVLAELPFTLLTVWVFFVLWALRFKPLIIIQDKGDFRAGGGLDILSKRREGARCELYGVKGDKIYTAAYPLGD